MAHPPGPCRGDVPLPLPQSFGETCAHCEVTWCFLCLGLLCTCRHGPVFLTVPWWAALCCLGTTDPRCLHRLDTGQPPGGGARDQVGCGRRPARSWWPSAGFRENMMEALPAGDPSGRVPELWVGPLRLACLFSKERLGNRAWRVSDDFFTRYSEATVTRGTVHSSPLEEAVPGRAGT